MKSRSVCLLLQICLFGMLAPVWFVEPAIGAGQPPEDVKRLTFGDVQVVHFQRVSGNINREIRLVGPKTVVTVPEKSSRSTLVFHADTILFRKEKQDVSDFIDMRGNLRYTVTQKDPDGTERVLEGTAVAGTYRRVEQKIELRGDVDARLTDPARLRRPATLRAERIAVQIGVTPFQYQLTGNSNSEVRFAPRTEASGTPRVEEVRLARFREGVFQPGRQAAFSGPETRIEIDQSDGRARFEAERITLAFESDDRTVARATGEGRVQARVERSRGTGAPETVEGQCERAVFLAREAQVLLKGRVDLTLLSAEALQGPGRLLAEQVAFMTGRPYHYTVSGSPERSRLVFTPRSPVSPGSDASPRSRFAFGTITIESFERGEFVPGEKALFTGTGLFFRSEAPDAGSAARVRCQQVVARFLNEEVVSTAELTGGVTFDVQRVDPLSGRPQAARGKAERATFRNTAQAREVQLTGPLEVEIIDEVALAAPGVIRDPGASSLTLDLSQDLLTFDIESAQATGEIRFQPRDAETGTSAPVSPSRKAAPNRGNPRR
ncbi:MAG: hypothetical protein RMJ43_05945 [Chloroherpetonaceae bacterium]|nr:hypothetical protein [Chthonomonadaceae bacterium]MDW8207359.1 hypothetical protein [Chloroherpetonaceae bacterium]